MLDQNRPQTPTVTANCLTAALGPALPKPTALLPDQLESSFDVWGDDYAEVGYWECSPGRFTAVRDGYSEVCQIVSGRATIHPRGGDPVDLEAGMTLVMPDGWVGEWEVHKTVRKMFVTLKTR